MRRTGAARLAVSLVWLLTFVLPVLPARPVYAATTWTVTGTGDAGPACTGNTCTTLRAAIAAANLTGSANTITFDLALAGQTIRLSTAADTDFLASALLVTSTITIEGLTAPSTVTIARDTSVANLRLFYVKGSGSSLTLRNLTIQDGLARGGDGGSGSAGGGGGAGLGGAIFNEGTLIVEGSTLTNNQAVGGNGGNDTGGVVGLGGGPHGGTTANRDGGFGGGGRGSGLTPGVGVFGGGGGGGTGGGGGAGGFGGGAGGFGGGGGGGLGGAIFNHGGIVSLTNSTLSGNTAQCGNGGSFGGGGGSGFGGGLFSRNGTVTITNSTLANNTVVAGAGSAGAAGAQGGGGIYALSDGSGNQVSVTMTNTIVADTANGVSDFQTNNNGGIAPATSGPNNLVETNPASPNGFTGTNPVTGDPNLGPLADNGGPTLTHKPQTGSPALNAGTNSGCPSTDQRGVPRPAGGTCDIGAYEEGPGPPTISSIADLTILEDTGTGPLSFGVADTDVPASSAALSVTGTSNNPVLVPDANIVVSPVNGGAGTRTITVAPVANAHGAATITLTVRDGDTLTGTSQFTLTVTSVNDQPVRTAGSVANLTLTEDDPAASLGLTGVSYGPGGGSDETGQNLTYTVTAVPSAGLGSVTLANDLTVVTASTVYTLADIQGMKFKPAANANGGPETFTYTVTDNGTTNGSSDPKTLTESLTITVNAVNDASVATPQSNVPVEEDSATTITLSASDVDSKSLTFGIVLGSGPNHGTLGTLGSPSCAPSASGTTCTATVTYTPNADYNGPDSFQFTANDGTADSAPATVSISVNAGNDGPHAASQSVTTTEDTPLQVTLSASDIDSPSLTFSYASPPSHGTLSPLGTPSCAPSGAGSTCTTTLTYTPLPNYSGPDSITFTANDGTFDSAAATVSITVNGTNDAPVAAPQSATVSPNAPRTLPLTASDIDSPSLTLSIASQPIYGTLGPIGSPSCTPSGGGSTCTASVTYTPNANYTGPDSFTFTTSDGTATSSPAQVSLTVGGSAISIDDVTATEGNTGTANATFTVTLSAPSGQPVTVVAQTANGTAIAGSDYTATGPTTLTFNPGITSQAFTVPILGDTAPEADETFTVTLSNPGNATLGKAQGVGTIVNDDSPGNAVAIAINDVTVSEGNSGQTAATFVVSLTRVSQSAVTVQYATADGTATTADSDYQAANGTLTFASGEISKTVTVQVNGDIRGEGNETFLLTLFNPSNATIAKATGVGQIVDDDPLLAPSVCSPRPAVAVTSQPTGDGRLQVTVTASTDGQNGANRLSELRFGAGSGNVLIDVAGQTGRSGAFSVPLPDHPTSVTFFVRRNPQTPAQAIQLPLTVVDGCSPDWSTFVGAGTAAF